MATFKDKSDREWNIRLDAPSIMRIRKEYDPKFMLGDDGEDNTYLRVKNDPVLLCGAIFILCEEQRQSRGVNEKDFYLEVIGNGDTIEAATNVLAELILSFMPRRLREVLGAVVVKDERIQQLLADKALEKINDPDLEGIFLAHQEARMEAAIGSLSTPPKSATSSPES